MSKPNNRRDFLKKGLLLSAGIPFLSSQLISCVGASADKKLTILILGGTSFLGPHQIAYAIARGHKVSIFTRGKTKSTIHKEVFGKVEHLIGDREDNLKALENRSWDVIIDNSGRKVDWTKKTANLLKEKSGIYLYISSTGVFFPYKKAGHVETDKVVLETPKDANEIAKYSYDYGVMKANSEIETIKAFGQDRSIVVRPTYMFGPGDLTNRFIHWPLRLAQDGEVLVPGRTEDPVQYIDVRDVAEWCIRLAENKIAGTFNAVGPENATTMHQFVKEAAKSFEKKHDFVFVNDYDFLEKNKIYYIVPWIIEDEYSYGSARIDNSKAKQNGLGFRNLNQSIKDMYEWWNSDALTAEIRDRFLKNQNTIFFRESEILKKWKGQKP